jgi:heme/copper-type cytochrome/quinol oxidase subunit 2
MDEIEVTWLRALKLWWSFSWRVMVLTMLVVFPLEILVFVFLFPHMPKPVPGQRPDPSAIKSMALIMLIAWPIMMATVIGMQVQGMRWMLKNAKWSDFRVAILPKNSVRPSS